MYTDNIFIGLSGWIIGSENQLDMVETFVIPAYPFNVSANTEDGGDTTITLHNDVEFDNWADSEFDEWQIR